MYQDADIYLLDDPLSAVDAEVGRHLFEKYVTALFSFKIQLLSSNSLQKNLKKRFWGDGSRHKT